MDNVVAELRDSDFQPICFELGFGPGQDLPPVEITQGGVTLRISGFVDRVDGWVEDGRLYLRVVDYKTGRKSFDLTEVWNGLGLQMLLYLFTLEEEGEALFGRRPVPAGVLDLPARDAMVAGSRTMDEAARRRLLDKELLRRGLILDQEEVVQAMEHGAGEPALPPPAGERPHREDHRGGPGERPEAGPVKAAHRPHPGPDLSRDRQGEHRCRSLLAGAQPQRLPVLRIRARLPF